MNSEERSRSAVSRRTVLRGVAAGGATSLLAAGPVAGDQPDRHVVGTSSRSAVDAAKGKADSVKRVLDFGDIGGAVAGRFSEQALENLRKRDDVRYVEVDGTMEALEIDSSDPEVPWGVDRVDAERIHTSNTGSGADIAIIDTGIDSNHPDLQANLGDGYAVVSARGPYAEKWDDDDGHGTHCAGIADADDDGEGVVGVSTAATLHAVKVLDDGGSGSFSDVAEGIRWVADQGYDVGSMSLGASSGSRTVRDACSYAENNGVLLVAAAGNSGPCTDCVGYPAAYSEVIAVSSTTRNDSLSSFSSTGPEVDLAAPGSGIYSTYTGGGYETLSGTSMACPHVAGAAGQLMANGYSNTEARDQMNSTAEDIGLSSNEQGDGLLDVEAAVSDGSSDSSPTVDGLSASEVETSDGDAEFEASWSVSDPDGDLASVDLTLTDDTDGTTEDTASVGVSGSSDSGTTRLVAAGDDGSGNSYTVDITVTDSSGNAGSDSTAVSETEETSTAPTIDSFGVSTRTSGPWFRVESDWSVSDPDGDLGSVTTELLGSDDNVIASSSSDVSGSTASGIHEVRTRSNASDSVRLTVTDVAGNSTSETRSV